CHRNCMTDVLSHRVECPERKDRRSETWEFVTPFLSLSRVSDQSFCLLNLRTACVGEVPDRKELLRGARRLLRQARGAGGLCETEQRRGAVRRPLEGGSKLLDRRSWIAGRDERLAVEFCGRLDRVRPCDRPRTLRFEADSARQRPPPPRPIAARPATASR